MKERKMNRHITILLLMLAALCCGQRMFAQTEEADALVVLLNDGLSHSYILAEKPVVTFDTDKIVIKTADFITELNGYKYEDITKLYFKEHGSSSVERLEMKGVQFRFTDGSHVAIEGVDGKSSLTVNSLDGKSYQHLATRNHDSVSIDLTSAPDGVYIIKVNNNSYKIIKR